MLADAVMQRQNLESAPVQSYMDTRLRASRVERISFYRRLFECNIIRFVKKSFCNITPFFFVKKNDKQRLVLDCRRCNALFKRPPAPDMGAGEA